MTKHCVFYRTNLKYDGRVCSIIRSLALAYPKEHILLYEFTINNQIYDSFPENVTIIKPKILLNKFEKSRILKLLKAFEYNIKSLLFLLKHKPRTIQIHHEIVALGPLIYKIIRKRTILVYDDKELYHPRDKNIPSLTYWIEYYLIEKSDLIISCNKYRLRALIYTHPKKIIKYLLIDNYVFNYHHNNISYDSLAKIESTKKEHVKLLLHQGIINCNRGAQILKKITEEISDQWKLLFIGISDDNFSDFIQIVDSNKKNKCINIGYIDYDDLHMFYNYVDACILIYNSNTFNNNYCAPNRLYLAANSGKPIIINDDNTTLRSFITEYKNGFGYNHGKSIKEFESNYSYYLKNSRKLMGLYTFNGYIPSLLNYYKQI